MSLLEEGVEKKILIPKLQEYIEKDINNKSKEKHMDLICKFYLATLKELYSINSSTSTEPKYIVENNPNSNALEVFQRKLINAVHGSGSSK